MSNTYTATNAATLAADLAAELVALKPFANLRAACDAINGRNGGRGLRVKYVELLYGAGVGDVLIQSIGAEIDRLCSREIALLSPIQDRETGWTSWPVDQLTEAERAAL